MKDLKGRNWRWLPCIHPTLIEQALLWARGAEAGDHISQSSLQLEFTRPTSTNQPNTWGEGGEAQVWHLLTNTVAEVFGFTAQRPV